uniref:Uncharacterized protein n=1 Tax=Setaria viridis TaxID=4556 RepID=A0A4U6UQQ6_SETVI|nr:hypothetical protein SEVIR_5G087750v2 [Setaria viridis]
MLYHSLASNNNTKHSVSRGLCVKRLTHDTSGKDEEQHVGDPGSPGRSRHGNLALRLWPRKTRRWVRARATWRPTAASSGAAPSATSSRGSTPATTSSASATPSARSSRSTRQEVPVHRHLPRHPIRSPPCNWLCSLQLISHRTAFFSRNKLAVSAFQSAYKSNRTDLSSTQVAEPTNFYPPPR